MANRIPLCAVETPVITAQPETEAPLLPLLDVLPVVETSVLYAPDAPLTREKATAALPFAAEESTTYAEIAAELSAIAKTLTPEMKARPIAPGPQFSFDELPQRPSAFVLPPRTISRVLAVQTQVRSGELSPPPRMRAELAAFERIVERQLVELPAVIRREPTPEQLAAMLPFIRLAQQQKITLPGAAVVATEQREVAAVASEMGMDVEVLAQIVMLECAGEQEKDLKAVLDELKAAAAQKKALRERVLQAKSAKAAVEKQLRDEYNARTKLDPANSLYVDPAKHSFEDYVKDRELAMNTAAVLNDPETAPFELALTNVLPEYAPWQQDLGPAPTFEKLDEVALAAQRDAQATYANDKAAYDREVTRIVETAHVTPAEAAQILTLAVRAGISNDSAIQARQLMIDASAIGLNVPAMDQVTFADLTRLVSEIDANRAKLVENAGKIPEATKTKVLEQLERAYKLRLLQNATENGTGYEGQIEEAMRAANEAAKDLTPFQRNELNKLVVAQNEALADAAVEAYRADREDIRVAFRKSFQEHEHAYDRTKNLSEVAIEFIGSYTDDAYEGTTRNHETEVVMPNGKVETKHVQTLQVKLLAKSHIGQFFGSVISANEFNRSVQTGALGRDFTVAVGNVVDTVWGSQNADYCLAFAEDAASYDGAGHAKPGMVVAKGEEFSNYLPWVAWMNETPKRIAAEANATLLAGASDTTEAKELYKGLVFTARGEGEVSVPVDPSKAVITGIPELDAALGDEAKLYAAAFNRWPTRAHFERAAKWLATRANDPALAQRLLDRYDQEAKHRAEVIDVNNDRLFRSHPEPSSSLQRLTLAAFNVAMETLEGKIDTLADLTQQLQIRVQLATDRRAKMFETLSNLMKRSSQTASNIIGNIK